MQTNEFGKSKGLWETLTKGNRGYAFHGLGILLMLTSNPAIQYTVFDHLKQRLLARKLSKEGKGSSPVVRPAFSAFLLGAVSKSIAIEALKFLRHQLDRCKVMIQTSDSTENGTEKPRGKHNKTIYGVLLSIWEREGLLEFFKGLRAQILKTVLSSALLLMIKQKIGAMTWVTILAARLVLLAKGQPLPTR